MLSAYFIPVMYTLLQILSIVVLGFYITKIGTWSREFFQTLSNLIGKVALPIYFFTKISQTDPEAIRKSLIFPLASAVIVSVGVVTSRLLFQRLPYAEHVRRAGIAMSSFGNTGIIPLTLIEIFPLTLPVIGERFGVQIPSLYVGTFLLVNSSLLWSLGNYLISGKMRRPRLRELITPPLIGITSGLAVVIFHIQPFLFNEALPFYHIFRALERFGQVTIPIILLTLGAMIARIHFDETAKKDLVIQALMVAAMRFLLFPLLFLALYFSLLRHLPLTPAQLWVLFLETHIPPATNLSIMAAQANINENQVSFTILLTYLAYLFIFPVYLVFFLSLPGVLN